MCRRNLWEENTDTWAGCSGPERSAASILIPGEGNHGDRHGKSPCTPLRVTQCLSVFSYNNHVLAITEEHLSLAAGRRNIVFMRLSDSHWSPCDCWGFSLLNDCLPAATDLASSDFLKNSTGSSTNLRCFVMPEFIFMVSDWFSDITLWLWSPIRSWDTAPLPPHSGGETHLLPLCCRAVHYMSSAVKHQSPLSSTFICLLSW